MPVTIEVDQEMLLEALDELKSSIQGYLSEPDINAQEDITSMISDIYTYIVTRPLASSYQRRISSMRR